MICDFFKPLKIFYHKDTKNTKSVDLKRSRRIAKSGGFQFGFANPNRAVRRAFSKSFRSTESLKNFVFFVHSLCPLWLKLHIK